jgi:MFS family permease
MGEYDVRAVSLAVVGGVFFGGIATGVAFPTLPLLDDLLGITAVMLGLVLAANRIARLVMNTPAGSIIDRVGARTPMIVGLFTQALAPFGYVVGLHTPPVTVASLPVLGDVSAPGVVFVLARTMWGVGSAFVFIGAFAVVTHVTTADNRGKWIGYVRGGQSLGFPTGLVVGGVMTDLVGIQEAFLVAGACALVAGVVAAAVLPDVTPDHDSGGGLRDVPALLRRRPVVLPIGVGNFTLQLLWGGVLLTTLAKYAEAFAFEIGPLEAAGVAGVVMGGGVLVTGGVTLWAGQRSDELGNRALLTVPSFLALVVGFGLIALVPALPALVVGILLAGAGVGAGAPALLTILGDVTPGDELGRLGGVYNTMGDVGLSLGPLVAIPAVETAGYRATYLFCAGLVAACLLVVSLPLLWSPASDTARVADSD